jgi:hypothetical protein
MARPVVPFPIRCSRDIEYVNRLRAAILIDRTLQPAAAKKAIECIDALIPALVALMPNSKTKKAS